jgi:hypothetical protein
MPNFPINNSITESEQRERGTKKYISIRKFMIIQNALINK